MLFRRLFQFFIALTLMFLSSTQLRAEETQVPVKEMSAMKSFGYLKPTESLKQQKWYQLDLQARKALDSGNYPNSERLFKEAIAKAESKQHIEPGYVNSLVGLSLLYHKMGNPKESERIYEYAMRTMEGIAGRTSLRFAKYLPELGWLYHDHNRVKQADILFKQHLQLHESSYGKQSPKLIDSLTHYSNFLKKTGRTSEAGMLKQRVQGIKYKSQ